ncbi:MAG: tRNA adenosine(34) deaminase TadA [Burkholderiaceae bacterium]
MQRALAQAALAEAGGEVPVGAVLTLGERILAEAHNTPIGLHDPTAHAEMLVIRRAGEVLGNYRLIDATLYVSLEPCAMCAGAILHARIGRVVFGAADARAGACGSVLGLHDQPQLNHRFLAQGGCLAVESQELLQRFFLARRPVLAERLQRIERLEHLPGLDAALIVKLRASGIDMPVQLAGNTYDDLCERLAGGLMETERARLRALAVFVAGESAVSWKTFLPSTDGVL